MATIDVKRLAAEVSVQHGIRLDPDDPIMAVVTLNQLVFEQSVSAVLDRVESAVRELEQAADKVQARAGIVLAREVRDCVVSFRREMSNEIEAASSRRPTNSDARGDMVSMVAVRKWIAVALVFAAGLFSAGVWLGACLRS
jgi:hypothetical protein